MEVRLFLYHTYLLIYHLNISNKFHAMISMNTPGFETARLQYFKYFERVVEYIRGHGSGWVLVCVSGWGGGGGHLYSAGPCADPELREWVRIPRKSKGFLAFLRNTAPPPENHTLPSQHSMLGHHRPI